MKFLAVFLLTLSLVATSSFAVSLNPWGVMGAAELKDGGDNGGLMLGEGLGVTALGGLGLYWAF
ncbi:MAG: hypothetical protein IKC23_02010 [Fibrobacter sp.]|nr:hypothetical protein [Fibrobacter sp.]